MDVIPIEVPCVPFCELVFQDPSAPEDRQKWVRKHADFDMLVRMFQAIDHTYPVEADAEAGAQPADFDAIGARMGAYREVLEGLANCGPNPGEVVPFQTEGYLAAFRRAIYKAWLTREEKKTGETPPRRRGGGKNSSSAPSPSAASSTATPPAGPAGGST